MLTVFVLDWILNTVTATCIYLSDGSLLLVSCQSTQWSCHVFLVSDKANGLFLVLLCQYMPKTAFGSVEYLMLLKPLYQFYDVLLASWMSMLNQYAKSVLSWIVCCWSVLTFGNWCICTAWKVIRWKVHRNELKEIFLVMLTQLTLDIFWMFCMHAT